MNVREALKLGIDMGRLVSIGYLEDLSDADLLRRPHPKCNHVNWQVGHLVASEHEMNKALGLENIPPLPEGFAAKYTRDTASSNDPAHFATKAELLRVFEEQRAGTLAALETLSDSDLDKPSGLDYAPTVGAVFSLHGSHWLMHAGQWVIVRRELGKAPMF